MKIVYLVMVMGALAVFATESGDLVMSARARSLMSALSVKEADGKELPSRIKGPLSAQKFKTAGTLIVTHGPKGKDGDKGPSLKVFFSDQNGKAKAFGKIKYAKSAKEAQSLLFEHLAMNSLPLELLLTRYELKQNGPGDLCVVEKVFDKSKNKLVTDESRLHFVRGNVVVSVYTKEKHMKAEEIAVIMDNKLVADQ